MEIADFSILDVLQAVRRNKIKVAVCFCLVMGAAVVLNSALPRKYESEAQLLVRLGRENATLDPTTTIGEASTVSISQSREFETNSVATMLRSRPLAERVVDSIGLQTILDDGKTEKEKEAEPSDPVAGIAAKLGAAKAWVRGFLGPKEDIAPRDRAIRKFEKSLQISPLSKTNLISLSYRSRDPELAQQIVASVIEHYGEEHARIYRATGAHEFLQKQKQALKDELSSAESELMDLKSQTGLISPDEQRVVLVERLGVLQTDLFAVEALVAETQREVDDLKQLLASLSHEESPVPQLGATSEVSDAMRSQLYELQLEAQSSLSRFSDDHVKARHIRKQILAGRNILAREETLLGIQKREPQLRAQRAKVEKLNEQIAEVEDELRQLNENEVRIAQLQRTVDLRDLTYRQVAADAEQARIDQSLELAKITNISIVQPATRDPYAVSPNTAFNMAAALSVAIFLGIAVAVFAELQRTPQPIAAAVQPSVVIQENLPNEVQPAVKVPEEDSLELASHGKPR